MVCKALFTFIGLWFKTNLRTVWLNGTCFFLYFTHVYIFVTLRILVLVEFHSEVFHFNNGNNVIVSLLIEISLEASGILSFECTLARDKCCVLYLYISHQFRSIYKQRPRQFSETFTCSQFCLETETIMINIDTEWAEHCSQNQEILNIAQ